MSLPAASGSGVLEVETVENSPSHAWFTGDSPPRAESHLGVFEVKDVVVSGEGDEDPRAQPSA